MHTACEATGYRASNMKASVSLQYASRRFTGGWAAAWWFTAAKAAAGVVPALECGGCSKTRLHENPTKNSLGQVADLFHLGRSGCFNSGCFKPLNPNQRHSQCNPTH